MKNDISILFAYRVYYTCQDFSWFKVFVQTWPEVVLYSADDQIQLEEDGWEANHGEDGEE